MELHLPARIWLIILQIAGPGPGTRNTHLFLKLWQWNKESILSPSHLRTAFTKLSNMLEADCTIKYLIEVHHCAVFSEVY